MSLKFFHILFITMSVLLSWGFGIWCIFVQGTSGYLTLGVFCFLLGFGLIAYGVAFWRKLKQVSK